MKWLSIILVVLGAGVLLLSMHASRRFHNIVPRSFYTRWLVLTCLLCFFVFGYCGYIIVQLTGFRFPLELLVGCVFFGGALFVYGILSLTRFTFQELKELHNNLETIVENRTLQLGELNQSLIVSQKELQGKNSFLNNVINGLSHPFYVIDVNTYKIVMGNKAAGFDLSGPERTCHWLTHGLHEPCGGDEHPCPIKEIQRTGAAVVVEHVHFDKNGNQRNVEVHGYPIYDDNGELTQIIEYIHDITEKK